MDTPNSPEVDNSENGAGIPVSDAMSELVPASFALRMIAFIMDYVLIMAAMVMISTQVLYPLFHPGFLEDSKVFIEEQQNAVDISFKEQMSQYLEFQMEHEHATNDTGFLLAVLIWMYFALSELFLGGSTLGKKIFKLSLIDLKTLNRPEGKTILLRNCLKSLSVIMPILFVVNLVFVIFNRSRLAGHDLVSKTMVTYDYAMPPTLEDRPND